MLHLRIRTVLAGLAAAAAGIAAFSGSYVVPLDHEAIDYAKRPLADPITKLNRELAFGNKKLEFEDHFGYLRGVLQALEIPIESQVLVFSKTSFQAPKIAPRAPRALYYNDKVSIGWVRGGDVIEVAAVDPKQGVIFYTLDQEAGAAPRFERRDTCLQCHASGSTVGVPGLVVRSVFPEPSGMPLFQAGSFVTDHRSPMKERWGGWYVTGTHGDQVHMGNAVVRDRATPDKLEAEGTQNITDVSSKFDTGAYLSPHSDIVSLMVLEHQVRMTNLLTRVGFETRMALHSQAAMNKAFGDPEDKPSESATRRINSGVEELLEYMLFTDEALLTSPVRGSSEFSKVFTNAGIKDKAGRSLRALDLEKRLFRYPCSYLIYSEAFDALPVQARDRVYRRLWEILTGRDTTPKFAKLSASDRKAVFDILIETKPELPDYWRTQGS
jgi:hypothetical protein